MIVLDMDKVGKYLENIAYGFGATVVDLLIIVGGVLLFILFLVIIYIIQRKKKLKKQKEHAARLFEQAAKKAGLTNQEKELAERMAEVISPELLKKPLVLKNHAAFNSAASKMEKDTFDETTLNSLRLKLDFAGNTEKIVNTTLDLPKGQHLFILPEEAGRSLHGRISEKQPDGFYVTLQEREKPIEEGTFLQVYFHRGDGVYLFSVPVAASSNEVIKLPHTEFINRVQRRNFYRRSVDLPAELWEPGKKEATKRYGRLYDLGGGGAALDLFDEKKGSDINKNERYTIGFSVPDGKRFAIPAKVVRISRKGRRVHFEFDEIREGERDQIVNFVLQQ